MLTFDDFNQIEDLRPYLLQHPGSHSAACHLLGDLAQKFFDHDGFYEAIGDMWLTKNGFLEKGDALIKADGENRTEVFLVEGKMYFNGVPIAFPANKGEMRILYWGLTKKLLRWE